LFTVTSLFGHSRRMGGGSFSPSAPDQECLLRAIDRTRTELLVTRSEDLSDRLEQLLKAASLNPPAEERLVLKLKGRIVFLNLSDIDWIEASGNHVRFHVGKELHVVRMPLIRVSEKLDPANFRQVHRSIIVNVKRIKELIRCNLNEFIVVLQDGKQLPCGRHYSASLRALFKDKL